MIRIFFYPDFTRYVLFTESALEHMYQHVQREPWQPEAGGEIFSSNPDSSGMIINAATGPNARDRRTRFGWSPNRAAAFSDRQSQFETANHAIGLWHTHPEHSPTPSSRDRKTAGEYLQAFRGDRSRYLMVIIGNDGNPPTMGVWVIDRGLRFSWIKLEESDTPSL